jgi:hypothetical protein
MVLRLACVLWRLRRAAKIETGLFQTEAEIIEEETEGGSRPRSLPPEWYDQLDLRGSVPSIARPSISVDIGGDIQGPEVRTDNARKLASCFSASAASGMAPSISSRGTKQLCGAKPRKFSMCCNWQPGVRN